MLKCQILFLLHAQSDRYGRLPVLVASNAVACAAGVATGFARGFADYVACRFTVGLAYDLHYM